MRRSAIVTSLVFSFSIFFAPMLLPGGEAQAKTALQQKHEAKGAAAKAASQAKSQARREASKAKKR